MILQCLDSVDNGNRLLGFNCVPGENGLDTSPLCKLGNGGIFRIFSTTDIYDVTFLT